MLSAFVIPNSQFLITGESAVLLAQEIGDRREVFDVIAD